MEDAVVLKGPVPSGGVLPLVQVVGIGRQTNIVELLDDTLRIGQMSIRSGKVLSVDFGQARGLDALEGFVAHRGGTFQVRSVHGLPATEPLGDLRALLASLGRDSDRISLLRNLPAGGPSVHETGVVAPVQMGGSTRKSSFPPPAIVRPAVAAPVAAAAPVATAAPVAAAAPVAQRVEPTQASSAKAAIILAVASAKGGVGKTTLAMNLAVAMARRGLRVTLVDSDPNGGVSAAVNAHRRISKGAFDVICGAASLTDAIITTRMNGLRVLPAGGQTLSIDQVENAQQHRQAWRALLAQVACDADVVVLDTPGGVYGGTRIMLGCATHVMGVLQAEPLALRASEHFQRAIGAVTPAPKLVGVVLNMFDPRSATSPTVLQEACESLQPGLLFDTSVPRTSIINDASQRGVVAGQGELATAPAVAWTFEQLSAELLDRLEWSPARPVVDEAPLF